MAKKFSDLEDRMPPDRLARAKQRAKEMMAEMLLAEIRQAAGMTQAEVAAALGIKQPTLSRLESQGDMQISTLQRIIQALGGELDVIARLPTGTIRISQFNEAR